jgi:hypothetical protein
VDPLRNFCGLMTVIFSQLMISGTTYAKKVTYNDQQFRKKVEEINR